MKGTRWLMASHHTDSHGLFLLSRRYLFVTNYSFVTRRVTDDLYVTNYRIFLHTENLSIPNLRICELFFTRRITDGHGGFICHELANLRIVLHTENCGWSRRIYLSRISELFFTRRITDGHGGFICHEFANCSSHGWSRRVTEDFFGMRPLLWTY